MQNLIHTFIDPLRDRLAPLNHVSNFRTTGQITPEEFQAAGDFLTFKFPTWNWADAATPGKRVSYFPAGKQYLFTRGVPCRRRIKSDDFAGAADEEEQLVRDMLREAGGEIGGDDDGWLKAGGNNGKGDDLTKDIRTVDEDGKVGERSADEEEEIPDMDDEDDEEAIIRDTGAGKKDGSEGLRIYTLYITYSPYYRTPRTYLLGYDAGSNQPLPPADMMEDVIGDYKDKTVTLEDFNFYDPSIKTLSIHPCKHASVMKVLLDRADDALRIRIEKLKHGQTPPTAGMEGLIDQTSALNIKDQKQAGAGSQSSDHDADWEVLSSEGAQDAEVSAIRVDQYLIVFLKFMASVTPGIEYDYTMGI